MATISSSSEHTSIFPKIYDVIQSNPKRNATLRRSQLIPTQGQREDATWDIFSLKPIQPPGALSLLLWHTDSMYSLGSPALRKQILTEKLLELHHRVDNELVGRRYPRKKIQDLLAGQITANEDASITNNLLEEVLCQLFQIQKVQINRKTKTISFFPPDIRTWHSDRKVIFSDHENCWYYEQTNQESLLLNWLAQKEDESWTVQWPTADGKLTELVELLQKKNLTTSALRIPQGQKPKKEDYAQCIGRAESIEILLQLGLGT